MDQNPLPRGSFQIRDRFGEEFRAVPELPEAAVAVEAQYPAHPSGAMIVVEVSRISCATDGAAAFLSQQHLVELDRAVAVAVIKPPWHVRFAPSGLYSPPFWT
jgi:hypothetical protein